MEDVSDDVEVESVDGGSDGVSSEGEKTPAVEIIQVKRTGFFLEFLKDQSLVTTPKTM